MPAASCPPVSSRHACWAVVVAVVMLTVACGTPPGGEVTADNSTSTPLNVNGGDPQVTTAPAPSPGPPIATYKGMPPVVDPNNIYSEAGANKMNPATAGALSRVYVPNEVSGTLTVIDPATRKVIDTVTVGVVPQHVVPGYDMKTLYVLNNTSNSIVPIDPLTGKTGKAIPVDDPYNLYFTPDGAEAIVVAEAKQRLDFADPHTFKVHDSLPTDCNGMNHIDYSIDGKYLIATCEFNGTLIKVDIAAKKIVGRLTIDITKSDKKNPIKRFAQPQDVRVANDGKVFYVADLITDGVYVIDGESFTQTGFIHTGTAAHGLYPSRDGQKLYVVNRGTNAIPAPGSFKGKADGSIAVLDFRSQKVEATWTMDGHGSPDMGNLTADGTQLWLGGRYDAEVYVFDTTTGKLLDRVAAGQNPHGLTVWPQPGRYSFGHTGNMR